MGTSIPFRNARWQTKFLHLLESINVPDTFRDWDEEEEVERGTKKNDDNMEKVGKTVETEILKTPEEYRTCWRSVLIETVGMVGLQMLSNLLFLVPIFVTGKFNSLSPHF